MEVLYWLIAVAVLLVIEIVTLGLYTIWFVAGALAAFFTALAGCQLYTQLIVFIIVSFVLLMFTRPLALKYFNKDRIKTNVDAMIGKQARVVQEINNDDGTGIVVINGQEWTARQEQPEQRKTIPVGDIVTVMRVSGVKVMVK